MGTLQSITNVNCCSIKRDDELSDDEAEGEEGKDAAVMCVARAQPNRLADPVRWDGGLGMDFAPATLERSVSNATTIPPHIFPISK